MSPEKTHKPMGFHVEVIILGVILYIFCCFLLGVYRVKIQLSSRPHESCDDTRLIHLSINSHKYVNDFLMVIVIPWCRRAAMHNK